MTKVLPELYVFVWMGKGVLEDYATGLVVVIAPTLETAWDKLKETDFDTYAELWCGNRNFPGSQEGVDLYIKWKIEDGEEIPAPIQPQRIELHQAPAFIKRGGG